MNATLKVRRNGQVTIPARLVTELGLSGGSTLDAKMRHGRLVLTPKPVQEDEETPEQHAEIMRQLAPGLEDERQGRVYGPFTFKELEAFLNERLGLNKSKRRQ